MDEVGCSRSCWRFLALCWLLAALGEEDLIGDDDGEASGGFWELGLFVVGSEVEIGFMGIDIQETRNYINWRGSEW